MSDNVVATQHKHHILIIEDNGLTRTTLHEALVKAGFLATVAQGGAMAMNLIKNKQYNLLLLEMVMPAAIGLKTCRNIRSVPGYEHTPVVIITGPSDTASIAEAFDAGATDFITRPISHELLAHRIRYVLRASQSMNEARLADRIKILKEAVDCLPIGIGIAISDTNGRIVYANSKEAEMHGYTPEEIIGMEANRLAPENHRKPFPPEKIRKIGLWERESANVRKNGEHFPVRLSSIAVRNAEGSCIGIVTACEDITSKKETEKRIEQLAYFDTLTNLPNRVTLLERLQQALSLASRESKHIAVLFLDLDNFKDVNDTLGHGLGDKLLQEVARRLLAETRECDTVARIGGDEFVVVLNAITGREEASIAAQRILSIFSKPLMIDDLQLYSSASIGIAVYPDDAKNPEELLKCSDAAMYHAKAEGRSLYWFFSDEINQKIRRRVALERHLREGIEKQEFFLQYQPQWDLDSGRMIGVEALLRWESAEFGFVPPSEFIPIAEMSGFILELGKWVLKTACIQARNWKAAGVRGLKMSVNISGKQLRQPNLVDMIGETIRETGIEPGHLELEFTESVIMENADANITTFDLLKKMGVHLSVDDFGTGYSSLSYLNHFPFDRIKIDRSFITNLNRNKNGVAIVEAIITMAHSLKLNVLAEGVETSSQLDILTRCKCDEIQGFYLATPVNADAIIAMSSVGRSDPTMIRSSSHASILLQLPLELPRENYSGGLAIVSYPEASHSARTCVDGLSKG